MNAADSLLMSANMHKERGKIYGSSYKEFGPIFKAFFPKGITLDTIEDMNRIAPLMLMMVKMQRYCRNFQKGGHPDSLIDLSTYSAMLNELDFDLLEDPKEDLKKSTPRESLCKEKNCKRTYSINDPRCKSCMEDERR